MIYKGFDVMKLFILGVLAASLAISVGFIMLKKTKNSLYAVMILVGSVFLTVTLFLVIDCAISPGKYEIPTREQVVTEYEFMF